MATVTNLYRHDCRGRVPCPKRWSKFPNHKADQAYLESIIAKDAIVHRHIFSDNKWITSAITIQSSPMRAQLRAALSKYHAFDPDLENWTFEPPFKPIIHRWEQLQAIHNNTVEPSMKTASTQLMDFLRPIVALTVNALSRTKETGMIAFEDIWQIFAPGDVALTSMYDVVAACRITKYSRFESVGKDPWWVISLQYIDWNGERCGYTNTDVIIRKFDGLRYVVSLPVHPLSFSESSSEIQARLVKRGRKFETLRGYHFRTCAGKKILLETEKPEERQVDSRVIIDAYAYYLSGSIVKPTLSPLDAKGGNDHRHEVSSSSSRRTSISSSSSGVGVGDVEDGPEMRAIKPSDITMGRVEVLDSLTDEECLLATPWVTGLDLKTKEWAQFCVDDLSPVVWNDAAFDQLALPGNEKELAWEFVENKALASNKFDDFIQDKGRGIIILMFGPPGVGKTFTAEAVSERARVPLYAVSAGALGTAPREIEATLDRALDLCKLWNAILLLDEADIFLGTRTDSDLARNELVALFLTKLEYYAGVCFLTTNRVATIDGAFQSRVDLFLQYKDLTKKSRRQVWENFMNRAGRHSFEVSSSELDELAEVKLNGRDIKNLIKSAHLLSLKSMKNIGMERLRMLCQNRINALALLGNDVGN